MTPYFNYKDTNGDVHQVWYDDAESMAVKYRIARESGIRGTSNIYSYSHTSLFFTNKKKHDIIF